MESSCDTRSNTTQQLRKNCNLWSRSYSLSHKTPRVISVILFWRSDVHDKWYSTLQNFTLTITKNSWGVVSYPSPIWNTMCWYLSPETEFVIFSVSQFRHLNFKIRTAHKNQQYFLAHHWYGNILHNYFSDAWSNITDKCFTSLTTQDFCNSLNTNNSEENEMDTRSLH